MTATLQRPYRVVDNPRWPCLYIQDDEGFPGLTVPRSQGTYAQEQADLFNDIWTEAFEAGRRSIAENKA
jgi:hypothetical protein